MWTRDRLSLASVRRIANKVRRSMMRAQIETQVGNALIQKCCLHLHRRTDQLNANAMRLSDFRGSGCGNTRGRVMNPSPSRELHGYNRPCADESLAKANHPSDRRKERSWPSNGSTGYLSTKTGENLMLRSN